MAHCDLKLENIVLDDDDNIVIIDLESLRGIKELIRFSVGTVGYLAPEIYH